MVAVVVAAADYIIPAMVVMGAGEVRMALPPVVREVSQVVIPLLRGLRV